MRCWDRSRQSCRAAPIRPSHSPDRPAANRYTGRERWAGPAEAGIRFAGVPGRRPVSSDCWYRPAEVCQARGADAAGHRLLLRSRVSEPPRSWCRWNGRRNLRGETLRRLLRWCMFSTEFLLRLTFCHRTTGWWLRLRSLRSDRSLFLASFGVPFRIHQVIVCDLSVHLLRLFRFHHLDEFCRRAAPEFVRADLGACEHHGSGGNKSAFAYFGVVHYHRPHAY